MKIWSKIWSKLSHIYITLLETSKNEIQNETNFDFSIPSRRRDGINFEIPVPNSDETRNSVGTVRFCGQPEFNYHLHERNVKNWNEQRFEQRFKIKKWIHVDCFSFD